MNPLFVFLNNNSASPVNFTKVFSRIGHVLAGLNEVNLSRGTTAPARVNLIAADYASSDQKEANNLYTTLASYQSAQSGYLSALRSLAQTEFADYVNEVVLQPDPSYATALVYLIAQMNAAGQTVKRNTVGASAAAAPGNAGNGNVVLTTLAGNGLPYENTFAETAALTVAADSITGGAKAGQETLTLRGQAAVNDPLSWLWPAGSGASVGLQAVSAAVYQSGGSGNWLNNGDFEGTWTANVPAGWAVDVGAAGTQILRSSTAYDGAYSLSFVGDGATLTSVYQTFNSAGGTTVVPVPLAPLTVNLWVATTPGGGAWGAPVFEIALTDGAGAVINDAAGAANVFTRPLVSDPFWQPVSATFRLPRVLPAAVRLRLRLSGALAAGATLYIDRAAATAPTSLYVGGPRIAAFSGNAPWVTGDAFTLTTTNDRLGGFQTGFDRLFGMRGLGLALPSTAGTPTVSESLIV